MAAEAVKGEVMGWRGRTGIGVWRMDVGQKQNRIDTEQIKCVLTLHCELADART